MSPRQMQIRISGAAHKKIQFLRGRLLEHGYDVNTPDIVDSIFDELDLEAVVQSFLQEKNRR